MPENPYQWAWFVFFVVGSTGGWITAAIVAFVAVQEFRFRRFLEKAKK